MILVSLLIWGGCSSTGSNSDSDSDNSNGNPTSASFNSGDISPDGSFSYTFENQGDVEYYCQIHAPDMQGKITVTTDAEPVDRDTVYMEGMQFNPSELSVAPNTEVVWINNASVDHNVTSGNPSDSGGGGGDY